MSLNADVSMYLRELKSSQKTININHLNSLHHSFHKFRMS
jgi:hypothetical protein